MTKNENIKRRKSAITALSISTAVLGLTTIGFAIGYGVAEDNKNKYQKELENVYGDNFYNLLDSVNNLENKVSKTLSSTSSNYQRKTLLEASKNASEAEISIALLPLSGADLQDTTKMVNQIAGYTSVLAEKLAKGESLTNEEIDTLERVHESVKALQAQLNEFERRLNKGFSITKSSMNFGDNGNEFYSSLSSMKSADIEYPSMIYDGPFSDSVVSQTVKGLKGERVTKERGAEEIASALKTASSIEYEGQTNGRFETFNYRVTTSDGEYLFVQVSQIGGHILTISGAGIEGEATVDFDSVKKIALEFASANGVENPQIVWSDSIGNDVYLNIAPVEKGIIIYPDLVKVKVNMASGTVVGYDATPYFTNHTERNLSVGNFTSSSATGRVPSYFEIISTHIVLSPLDYNREVVCIEVEAEGTDGKYYFYFNSSSGELEDVLKVIQTDNGNLLM